MENILRREIELLTDQYKIIKDFLSGAELGIDDLRETLQSFKDSLSKVRLLFALHFQRKYGNVVNIPIEPLMNSIDLSLAVMESNPSKSRMILQTALFASSIKIENVMALLSLFREGI